VDTTTETFPIHWENPADATAFWTFDQVHFPHPVSPMGAALLVGARDHGIAHASDALALPVRLRSAVVNHYVYLTAEPLVRPDAVPERLAEMERRMDAALTDLSVRWETDWRPELEALADALFRENLAGLDDAGLMAAGARLARVLERQWEIHFLVVFPIFHAGGALARAYAALTSDGDEAAPYRLLRGLPNATLAADRALHDLAALARADPEVAALVRRKALGQVGADLETTAAGQRFHAALRDFLAAYGRHSTSTDDLVEPTWAEDPSFVLARVRDLLDHAAPDPDARARQLAAEAAAAAARVEQSTDDADARAAFRQALERARSVWHLRETHAHWIDQVSPALCRHYLRELGGRLAARGLLPAWEDVLYLTPEEARRALAGEPGGWSGRAAAVRAELDRWATVTPPATLGAPDPAAPPPDPELVKFFGPPVRPPDGRVLHGVAASSGIARGPVRVARSLDDLDRVRPGDVLVCPSTTPPWTPLFATIAALVTDAGGVLSHGAIMAREYRLPAVTGTRHATVLLHDGQIAEVDGGAGVVRVVG
jgi:phosphohistidine swiveling domain-containing protein